MSDGFPELPGFRIEEQLGEGGFGVVYHVIAEDTGSHYAIKVLRADCRSDPKSIRRFRRELDRTNSLGAHSNLPSVHRIGVDDSIGPYMVMELIEGQTLEQFLRAEGYRVQLAFVVQIFIGVARAMQHLHSKNLLHGDLSPSNIIIASSDIEDYAVTPDSVKVVDFGFSRAIEGGSQASILGGGTLAYLSPESDTSSSPAADVWAFGCLMFEAITGWPPFGALHDINRPSPPDWYAHLCPSDEQEIRATVVNGQPFRFESFAVAAPSPLVKITYRCINREPAYRFSAAELVGELEAFSHTGEKHVVAPIPRSTRFRAWARKPLHAALLASSFLLAFVVFPLVVFSIVRIQSEANIKEESLRLTVQMATVVGTSTGDQLQESRRTIIEELLDSSDQLAAMNPDYQPAQLLPVLFRLIAGNHEVELGDASRGLAMLEDGAKLIEDSKYDRDAEARLVRAQVWIGIGVVKSDLRRPFPEVISCFRESFESLDKKQRLNPREMWAYATAGTNLGTFMRATDPVEAFAIHDAVRNRLGAFQDQFQAMIRVASMECSADLYDCGRESGALRILDEILSQDGESIEALIQRGWLLSTAADEALRDGKRALDDALLANKLSRDDQQRALARDTVAAAYAEQGDFTNAVKHERKALELVAAPDFTQRLELYLTRTPYRNPAISR